MRRSTKLVFAKTIPFLYLICHFAFCTLILDLMIEICGFFVRICHIYGPSLGHFGPRCEPLGPRCEPLGPRLASLGPRLASLGPRKNKLKPRFYPKNAILHKNSAVFSPINAQIYIRRQYNSTIKTTYRVDIHVPVRHNSKFFLFLYKTIQ